MTKATAARFGGHLPGGKLLRFLREIGVRVYAVGIVALVCWLSFFALRYLVVTLMFPSKAPPQIIGIPTRLDRELLQTRRSQWPGIEMIANPRTPPAHYHRVDGWIQPDRFNDCTQSGCHLALPHTKRKEVRAFLNMHATSIQCDVCHAQSNVRPLALTWYDLDRGKACDSPAALRAYEFVTSEEGRKQLAEPTAAVQKKLVDLLTAASRAADGLYALQQLARHVASVRPTSDAFQKLVEAVRSALPRHFRGEYGAKLALRDPATGRPILKHPETAKAVTEYLEGGTSLKGAERDALLARIHPQKRAEPLHCTDCHRKDDSLIPFGQIGYPPARQEALTGPTIFQMIQNISAGQPMNLPSFISPSIPQPVPPQPQATQPSM
ncbi:MAG TPA: hypothetical protein VMV94_03380 [Phycisphaerae bacterium]|nr:hypothetical protein [Phycisphaerae bacterium]